MELSELPTPALVAERSALDHNIAAMAARRPGAELRPHVKAFKCTKLAARLADAGHRTFCAATIREIEGLAAAGLGEDVLLANEVLDCTRLGALIRAGTADVTVAVDSQATIDAAARGGVGRVLIDVNIGLPRCGCDPADAGRLAERARAAGLHVAGVMGYEGHLVGRPERAERRDGLGESLPLLRRAWDEVGGDVCSGGGTGTYDLNDLVTEVQAGSYVLMDTAYAQLGLPFREGLGVLATVVSVGRSRGRTYGVADAGLKCFGMDHGNPGLDGAKVWFCSDEHTTFAADPETGGVDPLVGDRVRLRPAHIDPTIACHEVLWLVDGDDVVDRWEIDLRGW
ncbi:MAG: alanine racemase [Acidimicrobiia bacterium]|nr:alanine racemase [Acidimicrobiia bacterium]